MNYYSYSQPQPNPLEKKVKELEQDKKHLTQAIQDLNACYSQKIELLEQKLSDQNIRYEELLEWKQDHIDKSLFEVERYEHEIKKMISTLDNAHYQHEQEKQAFINQIKSQNEIITELKESNSALNQYNEINEGKIQEMVRLYTEEIQKLKQELKELREESIMSQSSAQALRDVTSSQNTQNCQPNSRVVVEGGQPAQSKVSIATVHD